MNDKIKKSLINQTAKKLFKVFAESGYDIYFVGGCVRDCLLSLPIKDIDLATTALPSEIIKVAKENGVKAIKTGFQFGTITLIYEKVQYQVTTFRKDVETDGRRAIVTFSKSITTDASRRDLTINALYADIDGTIVDPLNVIKDLKSRKIKFIGNPQQRILEDHLRILRFFRFLAWFRKGNTEIDPESLKACISLKEKLITLSGERTGEEMKKILSAPNPVKTLELMARTGILQLVIPNAKLCQLHTLIKFEKQSKCPIKWTTRIALMTNSKLKTIWKLSNVDHKLVTRLQKLKQSDDSIEKIAYLYGKDISFQYAIMRSAISKDNLKNIDTRVTLGVNSVFPVTAKDLTENYQGPALGKMLKKLQDIWIDSDFSLTKMDLLKIKP